MPIATTTSQRGEMFRAMRLGAGVSVRAVANRAEISHSTLSRWERGEREVSDNTYELLTAALSDFIADAAEWEPVA